MGPYMSLPNNSLARLLLLLLHSSRGILLKSSIRNLEAAQSTDSNIQNHNAQEGSEETHEDTCREVRMDRRPEQGNGTYQE